jgi:hypothetical protein
MRGWTFMAKTELINLADINLDKENPRLSSPASSHRDALRQILSDQEDKIVVLARHILINGMNPSDLPIVFQEKDKTYTVLEGNRRIVSLMLLNNPDLGDGILKKFQLRAIKDLHEEFKKNPIETLNCVVVSVKEEADIWNPLKHINEAEGAGTVRWGTAERRRFEERRGKKEPHMQALDWVVKNLKISKLAKANIQNIATSTLERILNDPDVRARLGIKIVDNDFIADKSNSDTVLGLTKIIEDLSEPEKFKVARVYTKADRKAYLDQIFPPITPTVEKVSGSKATTTAPKAPNSNGSAKIPTAPTGPSGKLVVPVAPKSSSRIHLIPKSCLLSISDSKINDLYHELRSLPVNDYPNAASVLIRVFLELSVDSYIILNNLVFLHTAKGTPIAHNDLRLWMKIKLVADSFEKNHIMSKSELYYVRQCEQKTYLLMSHDGLHQFVHNKNFMPVPVDLKAIWDNLQVFFEKLWP